MTNVSQSPKGEGKYYEVWDGEIRKKKEKPKKEGPSSSHVLTLLQEIEKNKHIPQERKKEVAQDVWNRLNKKCYLQFKLIMYNLFGKYAETYRTWLEIKNIVEAFAPKPFTTSAASRKPVFLPRDPQETDVRPQDLFPTLELASFAELDKWFSAKNWILFCNEWKKHHEKNRYYNVLLYDFSRVLLDSDPTFYIHVSQCSQEEKNPLSNLYLGQGPLPHTVDDQWKMIWEKGIQHIYCLTKQKEGSKEKSTPYDVGIFGAYDSVATAVKIHYFTGSEKQSSDLSEEQIAEFNRANTENDSDSPLHVYQLENSFSQHEVIGFEVILSVTHTPTGEVKTVVNTHFCGWDDHGIPLTEAKGGFGKAAHAYLAEKVHEAESHLTEKKPTLVHCSAGIGRTGVFFLALLAKFEKLGNPQVADFCRLLARARLHVRPGLVQSKEQFDYLSLLYRAIQDLEKKSTS